MLQLIKYGKQQKKYGRIYHLLILLKLKGLVLAYCIAEKDHNERWRKNISTKKTIFINNVRRDFADSQNGFLKMMKLNDNYKSSLVVLYY